MDDILKRLIKQERGVAQRRGRIKCIIYLVVNINNLFFITESQEKSEYEKNTKSNPVIIFKKSYHNQRLDYKKIT